MARPSTTTASARGSAAGGAGTGAGGETSGGDPGVNFGNYNIATVAGILVFVGGGLGTVVAAVTSFGANGGALEVARRNHTELLIIAAAMASVGLFLGAAYTVLKDAFKELAAAQLAAPFVLMSGVLCVAAGVVIGVWATVDRAAGRPGIAVERINTDTVKVTVTADGLAAGTSYETRVEGWHQGLAPLTTQATLVAPLVAGRFSPNKDGNVVWPQAVSIARPTGTPTIDYLLIVVANDAGKAKTCVVNAGAGNAATKPDNAPTCLYVQIPPGV